MSWQEYRINCGFSLAVYCHFWKTIKQYFYPNFIVDYCLEFGFSPGLGVSQPGTFKCGKTGFDS